MRRLTPNRARAAAARAPPCASVHEGAGGSLQACADVYRHVRAQCAGEKYKILVCLVGKHAMRRLNELGARCRRARTLAMARRAWRGCTGVKGCIFGTNAQVALECLPCACGMRS